METWIAKAVFSAFWIATTVIRYPFAKASKTNIIAVSHKNSLEKLLLALTVAGFMALPLLFIVTPWLSVGDYGASLRVQLGGMALMPFALWLFYRAHKDLGRNWSASLEIRDTHQLVDGGVYKHIRHPMYTAIWLWVIAQAMVLPNWIAGLSGVVAFGIMYAMRIGKEERMMLAQFGDAYEQYMKRTKRLIPFVL